MNFMMVFNQTLILFFLLVIGFIIRRLKIVDQGIDKNLTNLIIYVTLPALIINSMDYEFSVERLTQLGNIFIATLIVYLLMIALSYLVVKVLGVKAKERDVYQFILIFANVGFMGYPVIDLVFGAEGIFLAAIYNLIFNILLWTLGVIIISRSDNEDNDFSFKHLLNPGIISIGIGFLIFVFSLSLPSSISTTLEMLGHTTTPLAMIVVGSILAQTKIKEIFSKLNLWLITLVRLIILPIITLFSFRNFITDSLVLGVVVLLTAMPAAANTAIFANEFDGDSALASEGVFLTTLISVLTIPLIVYLL